MKKITLLLCAALCYVFNANAQIYLTQDFEAAFTGSPAAPPTWTQSRIVLCGDGTPEANSVDGEKDWDKNTNTGVATWTAMSTFGTEPNAAPSGTGVLFIQDSYFGAVGNAFGSRRMESPVLPPAFATATSPYVRFWYYCGYAATTFQLRVVASNDGGTTWNSIAIVPPHFTVTGTTFSSATPYQRISVKVPAAYLTANSKFGVEMTNSWGVQDFWIDDFSVEEFTPTVVTSIATGNWSNVATWSTGTVPTADNDVVIAAGHVVSNDVNIIRCQNMTVDGTFQAAGTTAAEFTHIFGNLTINATGAFNNFSGATGKRLAIGGNIVNNGSANFSVGANLVAWWGGAASSYSGTGTLVNGFFGNLWHSNPAGITYNAVCEVRNVVGLYQGGVNPNGMLTVGNPLVTTQTIERAIGSFTTAPIWGTGVNRQVSYVTTNMNKLTQQVVMQGEECRTVTGTRFVETTFLMNTHNNVQLTLPTMLGTATTGALTLTRGILITSATNLLTTSPFFNPPVGTLPTTVTGTGINATTHGSYIAGPLRINYPATGTISRNFPIGDGTAFNTNLPSANAKREAVIAGTTAASQTITMSIVAPPSGPTNAPITGTMGTRAYRLDLNGGPALSPASTLTIRFNNSTFGGSDNLTGNLQDIRIVQSPTLTGTWSERSNTLGTGAIPNNTPTARTTVATVAPGPINNGDMFFAWGTTLVTAPMTYVSSTTTQTVTTSVQRGTTNNQIIGIQIVTTGNQIPFDLTSLTLNSNGSTNFGTDVTNCRVWSTGGIATFSTTTLFGSAPNLSSPITGLVTLVPGTNYFWLTYDISATATVGDFVDAECTLISMNGIGGNQVPTVTAPAGNRLINYCEPVYTNGTGFGDYVSLVQLGTINNTTGGAPSPYYTYFNPSTPTTTTTLTQNSSYTITLSPGTWTANDMAAWIDWDQDGVFQLTEMLGQIFDMGASPATTQFNFTVPGTAVPGVTRLRVRDADGFINPMDPCVSESFGETEDYNVTILVQPAIDMSATLLVAPTNTGCYTANETVTVEIKNNGTALMDYSVTPVTVSADATGANPMVFTPVVLSTGTLAPNATQNVVITTTYDMTIAGTYTFNASTSVTGDGNTGNDAMAPVIINSTTPSVTASSDVTICSGTSTPLTSTASASGSGPGTMTVSQSMDAAITDFATAQTTINLLSTLNANQIIAVRLDTITHTWDSDMTITLASPNNTTLDLSSGNGGSGDNYIMTVLGSTGPSITTGTAPMTGNFMPEQALTGFTGSANGVWTLAVFDGAGGDQGTLSKWSMIFPTPNTITSYAWAPATGLSCTTCANPTANPTITTTYTVTVTDANGCTNTDMVTVTVNPSPVVALGVDQTQCGGTVMLDAGNPGDTYLWSDASTTQQITVSTTGAYSVIVTNSFGCSGYDTVNVTINPLPVVNLGADQTVCGSLLLDAQNPGSTYLWSTSATTQTITASSTGIYGVTVTDVNGCTNSDAITVTVNPLPTVALGADQASCAGTITLNAGNPGSTYLWSTSATTQSIVASTTGAYSVIVTDVNGCSNADTINITINPLPVVALGPNIVQCGGSVLLDAGNPGSTYFWSTTATTQTITVTNSATYTVQVTDVNGCSNADTIQVTINAVPVQALGNDTAVCGTSLVLNAQNTGSTYLWSTTATTQSITVTTAGTYMVTITSVQGCTNADTIVVTFNPVPTVNAGADTTICLGNSITLVAPPAFSAYLWEWDQVTSNAQFITVAPAISTQYTLTVTNSFGCTATDIVLVSVLYPPTASFTFVNVNGSTFNFTNTSTGSTPMTATWNFGDGSPLDNTPNPSHTYTTNGTYIVVLTVQNACGISQVTVQITVTGVGIDEVFADGSINIYPNPTNGAITIEILNVLTNELNISICDVQGKEIYSSSDKNTSKEFTKQIDLSGFANGVYSIRFNSGDAFKVHRLIIAK